MTCNNNEQNHLVSQKSGLRGILRRDTSVSDVKYCEIIIFKRKFKMKFLLSLSLIQAQLGCIPIQDFALTQDTSKIFRNGSRITRCMLQD